MLFFFLFPNNCSFASLINLLVCSKPHGRQKGVRKDFEMKMATLCE
jgi:hypothetical protein